MEAARRAKHDVVAAEHVLEDFGAHLAREAEKRRAFGITFSPGVGYEILVEWCG
jgi:hypothetical protein